MILRRTVACGVFCLAVCSPLQASEVYPSKPVRFIVPFPPGGANDVIARLLGASLGESMGKPFVIDNRGGANTIIGCELTVKANPDGYTILIVPASHAINPGLYRKLPYDSVADFSPLSLLGNGAYVMVANPKGPAQSVPELVALARATAGELRFASAGIGNTTHLAAELFNLMAGTHMTHVPYKGGGPAITDLLAGRVTLYVSTVALAGPHIAAGRLTGIGVTTATRVPSLPRVPTIAESGLPGYEVNGWYALLGPAKMPAAIVKALNAEVNKVLRMPEMRDKLRALGVEAAGSTPAELQKLIEGDVAKWQKVLSRLDITVE